MKKPLIIGIASVATIALLAAFGGRYYAEQRNPQQAQKFVDQRVNAMLDKISATDEQRAAANKIKEQLWGEGMQLKNSHKELHDGLMAQWQADKVDSAKAHALVDQQIDQLRAFAHQAVDSGIQLHDLLTPEQRSQLQEEMHRQGHGPGPHHP